MANVTTATSTQVTLQSPNTSTQKNFRQMIGEVEQWNPDAPVPMVKTWLNNAYRAIVDERNWYGLQVRGQVQVPQLYNRGTVSVTNGSNIVTGVGTSFTTASPTLVGQQFRIGFTQGWITVAAVTDDTHLTLQLPWGDIAYSSVGYTIAQTWVTLGPNIKYVREFVNQKQGYRCFTNFPQKALNIYDTWRTTMGWTFLLSPIPTTTDGMPQFELYPAPTFPQVFPFLAQIQPPDMVADLDAPAPFVRSDIITMMAIGDALLFGGPKKNAYYDPNTAGIKRTMAKYEVEKMKNADDMQCSQDLQWDFGAWPFSQQGSLWLQQHAGSLEE